MIANAQTLGASCCGPPIGLQDWTLQLGASLPRRAPPGSASGADRLAFRRTLLRLLAQGRPVSVEALAAAARLSEAQARAALNRRNVEYDDAQRIVGAGLSLKPSRHRIILGRRILYSWCALDVVMYVPLLGETARVRSPCAATSRVVSMRVTPSGVEAVDPPDAVISLLLPAAGEPVRQAFCEHVNFYSSSATAADWLRRHGGAVVLPVAEGYELGCRLHSYCC